MKRIFALSKDRKGYLIVSGILSSLAAIASFVPYFAIYYIIRDLVLVYPNFNQVDVSQLLQHGTLAVMGIVVDVICYLGASIFAHIAAFGTQYKLKTDFTKHLSKIPLGFHLTIGSGRFRKVLEEDIEKIESFLAHQFPDIVASFVAPIIMIVVLFIFDWRFGLGALVAVIIAFAVQMVTMGLAGPEIMKEMHTSSGNMNSAAIEYVRGMPVLKAFGQSANSFKQLFSAIQAYTKCVLKYTMQWENYTAAFQTIINNIYLFILPIGIFIGSRTDSYQDFLMNFIFYLIFTPSIASVLNKLMYVSSSSMRIAGGIGNFDTMMELPVLLEGKQEANSQNTDVVFENVSFAYEKDGQGNALENVSFVAKAKEVTAIVGPSGSGKSTIAHLIPRFWDVDSGRITIGGVPITDMKTESLMQQVSFVFQDTYLFGQSIAENIRMGNRDITDAQVRSAAKAAQCDAFISRLPKGYDTVVGVEGLYFSGGEAQRINIARAIAKDAPIIVLDEATAFFDPENEHLIQMALQELMKNKTVIMIAHRLGTIKDANQIIVMNEGKMVEQGKHQTLLQSNQLYTRMWENYTDAISWHISNKEGK